jgi:hypothetical protein
MDVEDYALYGVYIPMLLEILQTGRAKLDTILGTLKEIELPPFDDNVL